MAVLVFIPFSSSWTVLFCAGIVAVLAIITIFLFKNRKLQIKATYVLLFLLGLLYALYFIFDRQGLPFTELFRQVRFTIVFPFIAFIFVYLAIRGIKKDEKLIRSLDRLR
jgi:hypothetical protein